MADNGFVVGALSLCNRSCLPAVSADVLHPAYRLPAGSSTRRLRIDSRIDPLPRKRHGRVYCILSRNRGNMREPQSSYRVSLRTLFLHKSDGAMVLHVPILLVLAYLGIGYCSWVLSLLTLGYRSVPLNLGRLIALPALASFIMVLWDLSMEAIWSTIDRAWVWRDGGFFFGVPLSNFCGWYFTAFLFYLAFAFYCRAGNGAQALSSPSYWRAAIVCYGICAAGNLLVFRRGLFPRSVVDASGRQWLTMDILVACALVSIFAMLPITLLCWRRLKTLEARTQSQ